MNEKVDLYSINGTPSSSLPCCGIYAASRISGVPIQIMFNAYKRKHKKAANWRGGTSRRKLLELLVMRFRVNLKPEGTDDWEGDFGKSQSGGPLISVRTFDKKYALPDRTYLIFTCTHAMVLCNGILEDQWHKGSVKEVSKSLARIEEAYWVKEKKKRVVK